VLQARPVKNFKRALFLGVPVVLACSLCYLAQAGPEPVQIPDYKDKVVQPVAPGCDYFRAHEWDFSLWGTYVFSGQPGSNHVSNDDPFTPDLDPEILVSTFFSTTVKETKNANPNERLDVGLQTKDTFLGRDDSWGGGVDVKYFWNKYFGVGMEGFLVDTETQVGGAGLMTLTGRYPMGRFAPYVWAGAGILAGGGRVDHFFYERHHYDGGFVVDEREFFRDEEINNNYIFFDGQVGVGFEVRFTCHVGMMADFAWNFIAPDEGDGHRVVLTPGGTNFDGAAPVTFDHNRAIGTVPGANGDNKDFGMVRLGLTISY
jgi:hypothetical protein